MRRAKMRPRPLDPFRKLPIIRDTDQLAGDAETYGAEEAAKSAKRVDLPVPDISAVGDYDKTTGSGFQVPTSYIRYVTGSRFAGNYVEYDLDSEDIHWLKTHQRYGDNADPTSRLSLDLFERAIDLLERESDRKSAVLRLNEAEAVLTQHLGLPACSTSQTIGDIHAYWHAKHQRNKKPLLQSLWPPTSLNDNNPHHVFRPREKDGYTLRPKNRRDDMASYHRLAVLRADCRQALEMIELTRQREEAKLELARIAVESFEQAIHEATDTLGVTRKPLVLANRAFHHLRTSTSAKDRERSRRRRGRRRGAAADRPSGPAAVLQALYHRWSPEAEPVELKSAAGETAVQFQVFRSGPWRVPFFAPSHMPGGEALVRWPLSVGAVDTETGRASPAHGDVEHVAIAAALLSANVDGVSVGTNLEQLTARGGVGSRPPPHSLAAWMSGDRYASALSNLRDRGATLPRGVGGMGAGEAEGDVLELAVAMGQPPGMDLDMRVVRAAAHGEAVHDAPSLAAGGPGAAEAADAAVGGSARHPILPLRSADSWVRRHASGLQSDTTARLRALALQHRQHNARATLGRIIGASAWEERETMVPGIGALGLHGEGWHAIGRRLQFRQSLLRATPGWVLGTDTAKVISLASAGAAPWGTPPGHEASDAAGAPRSAASRQARLVVLRANSSRKRARAPEVFASSLAGRRAAVRAIASSAAARANLADAVDALTGALESLGQLTTEDGFPTVPGTDNGQAAAAAAVAGAAEARGGANGEDDGDDVEDSNKNNTNDDDSDSGEGGEDAADDSGDGGAISDPLRALRWARRCEAQATLARAEREATRKFVPRYVARARVGRGSRVWIDRVRVSDDAALRRAVTGAASDAALRDAALAETEERVRAGQTATATVIEGMRGAGVPVVRSQRLGTALLRPRAVGSSDGSWNASLAAHRAMIASGTALGTDAGHTAADEAVALTAGIGGVLRAPAHTMHARTFGPATIHGSAVLEGTAFGRNRLERQTRSVFLAESMQVRVGGGTGAGGMAGGEAAGGVRGLREGRRAGVAAGITQPGAASARSVTARALGVPGEAGGVTAAVLGAGGAGSLLSREDLSTSGATGGVGAALAGAVPSRWVRRLLRRVDPDDDGSTSSTVTTTAATTPAVAADNDGSHLVPRVSASHTGLLGQRLGGPARLGEAVATSAKRLELIYGQSDSEDDDLVQSAVAAGVTRSDAEYSRRLRLWRWGATTAVRAQERLGAESTPAGAEEEEEEDGAAAAADSLTDALVELEAVEDELRDGEGGRQRWSAETGGARFWWSAARMARPALVREEHAMLGRVPTADE